MKKLIILFLCLIALVSFGGKSFGQEFLEPWADIWANIAAYETNAERKEFKSTVGRLDARVGVYALPLFGETWLKPYVAYVGVMSNEESFWNNNGAIGFGARFKPFKRYQASSWNDEWVKDLRVYAELLSISYYSQQDIPEGEGRPTTDTRAGLELWHEWNQFSPDNPSVLPDPNVPWAEVWSNLSFRTSNFQDDEFSDYIFYYQQKLGVQSDIGDTGVALEPYLRFDLAVCGKDYDWLNHFDYGAGLRVRPFKLGSAFGSKIPALSKLKVFVEIMSISWTRGKSTEDRPDNDFRFGIDFTFGR